MKQLDEYFKLQKEIFDYFGYTEDWVAIPLDDQREMYWSLTGEGHGDEVNYSSTRENQEAWKNAEWNIEDNSINGNECYSGEIYTQRFLPKWVYRGKDYTMVCVDTHSDGNKFLMVFSNDKEI